MTETTFGILTPSATAVFSGIRADVLLGGEQAPMTAMHMTVQPGQGAPQHISHEEDKLFQILTGQLLFVIDEQRIEATAGDTIFVPRGAVHGFSAQHQEAHMLLASTPARHDRFFLAMDALPLPHEMADVAAVCQRFAQSIVGPVITA
ncbi:cupin domain-containing protein [Novosphingobium terrae]|uniref:cupin domain-containing protein n=1 Tax=Novosphingobium terrae TaxID=2726189 RepID=UPI001980BE47|nr:cupin domain-containing protein [Novosphingobium terrae]